MNKWITIPIISVLAVGVIVAGVLYAQETGKLRDAQNEIAGLEGNVAALQTELSDSEAEVSTLESDLATAGGEVSTLKAELALLAVGFPDANLEAAIREAINKPEGPIYTSDLETLTTLEARERGISDLTGLEYCVNLESLDLDVNSISDISPLSGLTKLVSLSLKANDISDISPLSGLTKLMDLTLKANDISDISPLSGLTKLVDLTLEANNISDISVLVENSVLSEWGVVNLLGNPLSITSINVYIPQLEGILVYVVY